MREETNSLTASARPVISTPADENSTLPENDSELSVDFNVSPPDGETSMSATASALIDTSTRFNIYDFPDGRYYV